MPNYYVYQETTMWSDSNGANHIYVFKNKLEGRSANAVAYLPRGKDRVVKFSKPLKLDLKGRTFQEVD
jgi:hypothetical protein